MLHGPNDPPWGHCPHSAPRALAGTPRLLAPRRIASPWPQAREGTRWGVNEDSDLSGSARQQQTSRRSTGSPRAGSQGEGSLATRRSARADERRPAAAPARPSQARAGGRTDGPEPGHLMARSARSRREAGRALGRRSDRDRSTRRVPWTTASECPRRMPKANSAGAEGSMRAGRRR